MRLTKVILGLVLTSTIALQAIEMECTLKSIAKEGIWTSRTSTSTNTLYIVSDSIIVFGKSLFTYSFTGNKDTVEAYDAYYNGTSYLTMGRDELEGDVVIATPDGLTGIGYKCKRIVVDIEKETR